MWSWVPSISELLLSPVARRFSSSLSSVLVTQILRTEVENFKKNNGLSPEIGESKTPEELQKVLLGRIEQALWKQHSQKIQRVVNATGVFLHTNMGRAPLSPEVWDRAKDLNTGYVNLELQLENGERGGRGDFLRDLLLASFQLSSETEDVLVVNNNAAGIFLFLSTLPKGSEVIVSRGELVQIGGGFRIPDIMREAGVSLKEVGTTNHTTLKDYQDAITEQTTAILKVHPSNFTQGGFVSHVDLKTLSQICSPLCPLIWDQGAGHLWVDRFGEQSVKTGLQMGAHLVLCSGDKLLGGPQAGLAIGHKDLVARMRKHPLFRTFRPSRLVLSLLQEHLLWNLSQGVKAPLAGWNFDRSVLKQWAEQWEATFPDMVQAVATRSLYGGGSTPQYSQDSVGIAVTGRSPQSVHRFFRHYRPAIIGYTEREQVIFDLSTLIAGQEQILTEALQSFQETGAQELSRSCL